MAYETTLATAIRRAVENGENGLLEEEVGQYIFGFKITASERKETATTGVEHMGERETFIRRIFKVDVRYLGVDWYADEPATVALDLADLARQIEAENDDAIRMTVAVYNDLMQRVNH